LSFLLLNRGKRKKNILKEVNQMFKMTANAINVISNAIENEKKGKPAEQLYVRLSMGIG
jgi:uncharacterized alkaline shock family protein YloU